MRIHEYSDKDFFVCFADTSQLDLADVQLSLQRRKKVDAIKNEQGKKCSAGAGILLDYALNKEFPQIPTPAVYDTALHGKPYFKAYTDCCFSLSHSGTVAVCAVSNNVIGIDIQYPRAVAPELMQRCLTEAELAEVRTDDDFARMWTRKEAVIKADGQGLSAGLSGIDVRDSNVMLFGKNYRIQDLPDAFGCKMSVALFIC